MRISPLLQHLSASPWDPASLKERAVLRFYWKANHNFYLTCQIEVHYWRDIKALLDENHPKPTASQCPERRFRDNMKRRSSFSRLPCTGSTGRYDRGGSPSNQIRCDANAEVTPGYENHRLTKVLLNNADFQAEAEMEFIASQIKKIGPSSSRWLMSAT